MAKQFPVVRISFVTKNGVKVNIDSRPRSVLNSNRSDAKVIGADFSVIFTTVSINTYRGASLAPSFTFDDSSKRPTEFDDLGIQAPNKKSNSIYGDRVYFSSVYWDVRQTEFYLDELQNSLTALGASDDLTRLVNEIHRSRTLVRSKQEAT